MSYYRHMANESSEEPKARKLIPKDLKPRQHEQALSMGFDEPLLGIGDVLSSLGTAQERNCSRKECRSTHIFEHKRQRTKLTNESCDRARKTINSASPHIETLELHETHRVVPPDFDVDLGYLIHIKDLVGKKCIKYGHRFSSRSDGQEHKRSNNTDVKRFRCFHLPIPSHNNSSDTPFTCMKKTVLDIEPSLLCF